MTCHVHHSINQVIHVFQPSDHKHVLADVSQADSVSHTNSFVTT